MLGMSKRHDHRLHTGSNGSSNANYHQQQQQQQHHHSHNGHHSHLSNHNPTSHRNVAHCRIEDEDAISKKYEIGRKLGQVSEELNKCNFSFSSVLA